MECNLTPKYPRASTEVILLDGGLGTTLEDQFGTIFDDETRPLWSSHLLVSDPSRLLAAHTAFADSGADILLTATYQASFEGFARTKNPKDGSIGILRVEAESYMKQAVIIAQTAFENERDRDGKIGKVALSMGAYGAVMVPSQEYTGKYDEGHQSREQLRDWHNEGLSIFAADLGVWESISFVAFETIPLLLEIIAVREAMWMAQLSEPSKEVPFWISCVFPEEDLCLPDGSSVDRVVKAMLGKRDKSTNPTAIGINCTKIGKVQGLLEIFEESVNKMIESGELEAWPALVLYPDGTKGEVYNTSTHQWETNENGNDNSVNFSLFIYSNPRPLSLPFFEF
jgi:homocysteine S-methyltransferase